MPRLVRGALRLLCRLVLRVVGVRTEVRGRLPASSALLIANHLSWLDVVAVLAHLDCTMVAKREVADWPIIGRLARTLGVIFVDRRPGKTLLVAIDQIADALARGRRVLVFAEATTGDGRALLPFRSTLVEAAVRAGTPVIPLALTAGARGGDVEALCWLGEETLIANLPRVRALHHPYFRVQVGTTIPAGASRKMLTHRARIAIEAMTGTGALHRAQPVATPVRAVAA